MFRGREPSVGSEAWFRYAALDRVAIQTWDPPRRIVSLSRHPLAATAAEELRLALSKQFGFEPSQSTQVVGRAIVLGTASEFRRAGIGLETEPIKPEGFRLEAFQWEGQFCWAVMGGDARGILYATFDLMRRFSTRPKWENATEIPSAPIRYLNHWDNLDGSIERGYAGRSIFFKDGGDQDDFVTEDLDRVRDYARLLASIGINGCSLNNVNADERIYADSGLRQVTRIADALRRYGIQTLLSVSLSSPDSMGGLGTFDPGDPRVRNWWTAKAQKMFEHIPDLAGWVVKADSEGRPGPSSRGRTHADAANMLADALAPFGGLLFYRGFVYDHTMDWRDRSLDRARAAYENFHPLDGQFAENVVIQLKNGPIDFQVREPVSPTFAALEQTNTALELMITQEYLGQQRHTVYEVPWWKDSLEFDFQIPDRPSTLRDIVTGVTFGRPQYGFIAVSGVGRDPNWLGNHLAQANLYAFGRLAWDPSLPSRELATEWVCQTLTTDTNACHEISDILMRSWETFESYTGNLGIGGLTDIIHIHYGPSPTSSEHNGWGQWHRSDPHGTGMDRTVATGTRFTAQYPAASAALFEHVDSCPDDLLLFFHHVPYTHCLKSGKSVIQHIYDAHYEGAAEVRRWVQRWQSLREAVSPQIYREVLEQLEYQAGHAIVWRDSICRWFAKLSEIRDDHGRVFNEPNRISLNAVRLSGFVLESVDPWEASHSGVAAVLPNIQSGSISFESLRPDGIHDIVTWFFDCEGLPARFTLSVQGQVVDDWTTVNWFPSGRPDGHTKTRRITPAVSLKSGASIELKAVGKGAAVDFFELVPSG